MSRQASGLKAWYLQRLSALYIAVFFVISAFWLIVQNQIDFLTWKTTLSQPVVSIALVFFIISILLHAWVGIRDIIIDYVHPTFIRVTLLSLIASGLLVCLIWSLLILFQVAI